jgi:hypothetical protein
MSEMSRQSSCRPGLGSGRGFAFACFAILAGPDAWGQEIGSGDALVTRFSGTIEQPASGGGTRLVIDLDGSSVTGLSLADPGAAPGGRAGDRFPANFSAPARDVGQVFGIAVTPGAADIYLSATSAFGLHLDETGGGWMPGQWGMGGGPGTIYRLRATNDYRPDVFATIAPAGRANTGAALGNIAYDGWNDQLFVSDLESGMIHRLAAADGSELGRYDHGTEGRPSFLDAETGAERALPAIAFDPASVPRLADCPGGNYTQSPACWNLADFRRRVWGLAVHRDEAAGTARLYYATWSSQAFGNPAWAADPQEQLNAVWSVALGADGGFDTSDVRREFSLPGFFATPADYARAGGSHPVSDIAFSAAGDMLLAERGGLRNLGLGSPSAFAAAHEARVLHYRRNESGAWAPVGRHDVGFSDRKAIGQPFIRANAAGGAAFGFGHGADGRLDTGQPDAFVWMTGDGLCAADGPCVAADGTQNDSGPANGLQGQAAEVMAEVSPPAAFQPYPATGPATPAAGPEQAYMVDLAESAEAASIPDARASWLGDVAIVPAAGAPGSPGVPLTVAEPPPAEPPADGVADLAVQKTMPAQCLASGLCTAQITIVNDGSGFWTGPIYLTDILSPGGTFAAAGLPWICSPIGASFACYHPTLTLAPGAATTLIFDFAPPTGYLGALENCVELLWPLASPEDSVSVVIAVQTALTLIGYDPGPIDGSLGTQTRDAIAQLQADLGLPVTGAIDAALLDLLFPFNAAWPADTIPANDRACATTIIVPDSPPEGVHLPIGSYGGHDAPASIHLPEGSTEEHLFPDSVHVPMGSTPTHLFPESVHLPIGSETEHLFPSSVHLPIGSMPDHSYPDSIHLPIGSETEHDDPVSIHLPIGSNPEHLQPDSVHLPIGSMPEHLYPDSIHLPVGSNQEHLYPTSIHLPAGSEPEHDFPGSIHLPIGSEPEHGYPASIHLPVGSKPEHHFPESVHLPLGSGTGHRFPESVHLPIGSEPTHGFPASIHLPVGSKPEHVFPSSVHLPEGSNPEHDDPMSIHLPIGSAPEHVAPESQHLPIGSGAVHQPPRSFHLPIGSGAVHQPPRSIHLPAGSAVHQPEGSKPELHQPEGSNPAVHLPIGSAPPVHRPPGSVHQPVGSKPVHRPRGSVHVPKGSDVQIHVPRGSKPVHRPRGSVHVPKGSDVQIHVPRGSKPVHRPRGSVHVPKGSDVQIHVPRGSKPVHRPRGSVHVPKGSEQVHRPRGSVHEPKGSVEVHVPRGSKVHEPRGSVPQRPGIRIPNLPFRAPQ